MDKKWYDGEFRSHNPNAKLTVKDVLKIRELKNELTLQELANFYDVDTKSIENVISRKTWKDV